MRVVVLSISVIGPIHNLRTEYSPALKKIEEKEKEKKEKGTGVTSEPQTRAVYLVGDALTHRTTDH